MKLHLELRRAQTEIWIPVATLAHIQQSVSRLRQNIARISEVQFQLLPSRERRRKHQRYQIVPFSAQRGSFDRRVLDEVHQPPIGLDGVNLQIARQLEQQHPFSAAANSNVHVGRRSQPCRRLHRCPNPEACDRGIPGEWRRNGVARPSGRTSGRKRSPDIEEQDVVFQPWLPGPQRLGGCRIPEHLKTAQFLAQQMGVQQRREFSSRLVSTGRRQKMTEVQKQAESVKLRQTAARVIPFFYEFRALRHRR